MTTSSTSPAPALKEIFNAERFHHVAEEAAAVYPHFSTAAFLACALPGLDGLTLMQRLRRMTESLHSVLPTDYRKAIGVLRTLAPRINHGFVTLALPDYVGLYGHDDFDTSMDALKFFTGFGSSEFAVREFIRRDPARTLAVMQAWSLDGSEQVRRLASEGSRPRLPWSFRLDALMADPELAAPLLENLKDDTSLYVRKSVANHLNDITKVHPAWVMDRLESWPLDKPHPAWIARHALRTLIKQGDRRALALIGADHKPEVRLHGFTVNPPKISLGESISLSLRLTSTAHTRQRLVVDYTVHYVKKSGLRSAKVFKLKTLNLPAAESVLIERRQVIRDFTTRVHHAGRHEVEIMVNGECLGRDFFELVLLKNSP